MPAQPADDFAAFEGSEQMFFGLRDPYGMMRSELENALREQVADTVVASIAITDKPKFLTLGRRADDGDKAIVTHFGICARAKVAVLFDEQRKGELLEATLTYLFGHVDKPGSVTCRTHFDLHDDADRHFDDEVFKRRFMTFRGTGQA
jgi:hypothetical protein